MGKPNLTKTCSNCGLQKPLSAFLQLAGSQGTTYGNICADCRKAKAGQKAETPKQPEESTSSSSGLKIDSKAKVHREITDKKQHQDIEELYEEEREKLEEKKEKLTQKAEIKEKDEKEHRKSYLEKSSFLTTKTEDPRGLEARIKTEQTSKVEAIKQEEKLKGIDLAGGPVDLYRAGAQQKVQSSVFLQFQKWVGASAPVSRVLGPAAEAAEQKNIKIGAHREAKEQTKTPKESAIDDIEKTFKPSSKR